MLVKSFGLLLLTTGATTIASAYDVGCLWPDNAPDDLFVARERITIPGEERIPDLPPGSAAFGNGAETPIVIRTSHETTMCQAACLAYHSASGVKDPLTLTDPVFVVPPFGRNGYSTMMCAAQCKVFLDGSQTNYLRDEVGFEVFTRNERPDVVDATNKCPDPREIGCAGPCSDICTLIGESFDPYMVGAYLGVRISNYFDVDGWNSLGTMTYDHETDSKVDCTSSCRAYQNTVGYSPVGDPRTNPSLSNDTSKYECTGLCRRWQPLQEGDSLGNLKRQEFTVPHIGTHAKTYLRNATITLEDPMYDLYEDSLQVIEELRITSSDQYKKDQIELMDNKVKVRWVLQNAVMKEFADTHEMSFQEYLIFLIGISTAEHDGVVQAWKEKVHHDLVRPTTVIKHWGSDDLFTFGGDRSANGPENIKARDFEAFIRVMPHGEFPSGSSCLCKTYQEFVDVFMTETKGRTISDFGNLYNDKIYANMSELLQICGDSRVWAGLHYPPAVTAGEEICTGLGTLGSEWAQDLAAGADFGERWYKGTSRPVCGDRRHLEEKSWDRNNIFRVRQ